MRIEVQNEAGIWENLECEKCLNNRWETDDRQEGQTAFRCLLCGEGSIYIRDTQWREKAANVDVLSQSHWTRALNSNFVSELKHPYYRVDDEIRKVAENKEDARTKFELTPEQEASPQDAVIIDPMPERQVCREILDAALDEYALAEVGKLVGPNTKNIDPDAMKHLSHLCIILYRDELGYIWDVAPDMPFPITRNNLEEVYENILAYRGEEELTGEAEKQWQELLNFVTG